MLLSFFHGQLLATRPLFIQNNNVKQHHKHDSGCSAIVLYCWYLPPTTSMLMIKLRSNRKYKTWVIFGLRKRVLCNVFQWNTNWKWDKSEFCIITKTRNEKTSVHYSSKDFWFPEKTSVRVCVCKKSSKRSSHCHTRDTGVNLDI